MNIAQTKESKRFSGKKAKNSSIQLTIDGEERYPSKLSDITQKRNNYLNEIEQGSIYQQL